MRWKRSSGGDALVPVDAVLGEVDVLGGPLLALPEVVELRVARAGAPRRGRRTPARRVAGRLEVRALGPLHEGFGHGSLLDRLPRGQPSVSLAGRPKVHGALTGRAPRWPRCAPRSCRSGGRLPDQRRARAQAGEAVRDRADSSLTASRAAAEAERVGAAVGRAQLDPDRDERGHAHHARRDPPAAAREQRRASAPATSSPAPPCSSSRRRGAAPSGLGVVAVVARPRSGGRLGSRWSRGGAQLGGVAVSSSSPPQPASAEREHRQAQCALRTAARSVITVVRCAMHGHGHTVIAWSGSTSPRRRVWIAGQRVHHGATGVILALARHRADGARPQGPPGLVPAAAPA